MCATLINKFWPADVCGQIFITGILGQIFMTGILFLTKIFKAKLDANKKYQLFESCYKNVDTVQCQLSSLADSATYDNIFLKSMTVQAQQDKYSSNPTSSTRNT
jgi:hypothetical protein